MLHLHARRLRLPAGNGLPKIDVKAPLPPHMRESWAELKLDADDQGVSLLEIGIE